MAICISSSYSKITPQPPSFFYGNQKGAVMCGARTNGSHLHVSDEGEALKFF
jgi:hypothetical protein